MKLERYSKNPILSPTNNWWEDKAVYNAGATIYKNKIIILYRAQGGDGFSRFGLAESQNGFAISKRHDQPVFESDQDEPQERLGVEDSRISKIGDTYYIVYCAASVYPADGKKPKGMIGAPFKTRIALAQTSNFKDFRRLGLVLPNTDDKDGVLFPEKIDGKYILLHRKFPNIQLAESENLSDFENQGEILKTKSGWESKKIGAGNPPIKTEKGWLMFYHAADSKNIYRLGIVVFDLKDPRKIIYRSSEPVLEPEMSYEKDGLVKEAPEVVFTCGAIEKNGKFFVYYGASDKYLCVATIEKTKILNQIE